MNKTNKGRNEVVGVLEMVTEEGKVRRQCTELEEEVKVGGRKEEGRR